MTAEEPRTARTARQSTGTPARAGYAFGDVETAALRLQLMDRVFAAPNRALLDIAERDRTGLAVDLGCGPGYSARLIAAQLRPARLVGLDVSAAFLARARSGGLHATWVAHDVTVMPLPTGPADLLHARFVLSHLAEPESVLLSWLGQLHAGGFLVVQDDDEITTSHPVLAAYEDMVRSLVARKGGDLWVGARLAALEPPPEVHRVVNRVYRHHVPAALAAQMFAMNFAVWRHDPDVTGQHPPPTLENLADDLAALASSSDPHDVVFHIRQLGYRRTDG